MAGKFYDCEDKKQTKSFLKKVKARDALEFQRTGFYNHWGICTGRNEDGEVEVAHITAPDDTPKLKAAMAACGCGATEKFGETLEDIGRPFKEPLRYVMSKQNYVRVNNSIDNHILPFRVQVILRRVNQTLEDGGWGCYHIALNNCELYINYCRNGNHVSLQSLQKGRQTLGYLARGAKKLAGCPPTPEIGFVAAAAGTIFTVAEEYVTERERMFRGELEDENSDE